MSVPKAKSNRRGKDYLPEVALARGPQNMGVVGDASYNTLYGRHWALVLDKTLRKLRLFQAGVSEWVEVPIPAIPHDGREIRHISLCFDQSARHVMAYERAGQVWVRQWDTINGAWTMRGPFPGVDPVLLQDTTVGFYQPDSDVLLFYLSPDRKSLNMRVQRELYAVEHGLESYSSEKILDQAISLPYQFELVGEGLNVRSDIYPAYLPLEDLGNPIFSSPAAGNLFPVVVVKDMGLEDLGTPTVSPPTSGALYPVVIVQNPPLEDLGSPVFSPPVSGNLMPLVVVVSPPLDDLGNWTLSPPATGNYYLMVAVHDLRAAQYSSPDDLGTGTFTPPTGGTYVAA